LPLFRFSDLIDGFAKGSFIDSEEYLLVVVGFRVNLVVFLAVDCVIIVQSSLPNRAEREIPSHQGPRIVSHVLGFKRRRSDFHCHSMFVSQKLATSVPR